MVNVVISKKALGAEDGARVARKVAAATLDTPRLHIPVYDVLGFGFAPPLTLLYAPGVLVPGLFGDLLVAAAFGKEEAMIAGLPLDVGPIVDDRPFFFQLLGVKNLPSVFGETRRRTTTCAAFARTPCSSSPSSSPRWPSPWSRSW